MNEFYGDIFTTYSHDLSNNYDSGYMPGRTVEIAIFNMPSKELVKSIRNVMLMIDKKLMSNKKLDITLKSISGLIIENLIIKKMVLIEVRHLSTSFWKAFRLINRLINRLIKPQLTKFTYFFINIYFVTENGNTRTWNILIFKLKAVIIWKSLEFPHTFHHTGIMVKYTICYSSGPFNLMENSLNFAMEKWVMRGMK